MLRAIRITLRALNNTKRKYANEFFKMFNSFRINTFVVIAHASQMYISIENATDRDRLFATYCVKHTECWKFPKIKILIVYIIFEDTCVRLRNQGLISHAYRTYN